MNSIAARPAAAETGLPPKVVPCSPGANCGQLVPKEIIAPSGRPPPKPFAKVITSGRIFSSSYPNQVPVRPIPVCTQSKTKRTPCSLHSSLNCFRYPKGGTTTPASPIIGSTITIAVFLFTALRIAEMSPKVTCLIFFTRGLKGLRLLGCPVRESAPIVLPWNEPVVATIFERPVLRDNLSAASFASAPELQKNTRAVLSPVSSCNFAANAIPEG